MNRKGIVAVLLVIALVAVGTIVVLGMNPSDEGEEGPVTVIDAAGRAVTTSEAPKRIVSCSPSLTEIVYALGIGDRLVAVTDYCDWPEDVVTRKANGSLPSIGGYFNPRVEPVIDAEGDLILIDKGVQAQMDMCSQLNATKQKYIIIEKGTTFDEIYAAIGMIGEICWAEEEAEALIDSMKGRLVAIEEALGDAEDIPSLVFAVWLKPVYLSGNGTFTQDVILHAQGENVYSNMTGWPEVSIESLLVQEPEYLLVSMMQLPTPGEEIISELENDTMWAEVSAVRDGNVYIFTGQADNVFCRPGPRMVDAVELMAKILHPEVFDVALPHVIGNDYTDWVTSAPVGEAVTGSEVNNLALIGLIQARTDQVPLP
ncbi:MAG TPA: ABC transporter substrate-binding protein [Methanomassiliicoccales archaeon]|nr:ABC transporter substrate-binding protein [Methanomassiliicoccales archaeon]